jgi:deoxyribose-phosphate aldolase
VIAPDFIKEYGAGVSRHRTTAAILDALKRTHAGGDKRLRAAGEIGMLQTIRQFNGEAATRLSWMHHGIARNIIAVNLRSTPVSSVVCLR